MIITQGLLRKFISIPYKHQGRSFEGVDCWGLVILFSKEFGIELPDIDKNYSCDWATKGENYFEQEYSKQQDKWIKIERPQPLDIVMFKKFNGIACHAGVMVSESKFLHAYRSPLVEKGQVCLARIGRFKNESIMGFYRYKNDKVKNN